MTEDILLGATDGGVTYGNIINAMSNFFRVWTNATGTDVTGGTFLGQYIEFAKFRVYLIDFLPAIFAILGTIIAINLAIKAFKKFSR